MGVMAANALKEFLASERDREERERLEYERQQKEKDRILRRIMDGNVRMMGTGFRQSYQWMESEREKERQLIFKQRGIMNRMVNSNVRLMGAGFNKLIEEWKAKNNMLKDKLKFVIKTLTDQDAAFMLAGYNGLKQRALMLNGVGMGDSEMKKIQLIKRLTNKGFNLQVMAANALQEFLASERERQQKEKDRILRRIMDSNVRMMGTGFRQAEQWMEFDREKEINLMRRQRGIMRRIIDSNVRLMGAGYNKLIEDSKERKRQLMEKLKYVIRTLTDKDAMFTLMAHNQLKQRKLMLDGVGLGDDVAQKLKIRLIRKLTDTGYNLQSQGAQAVKEFLASERAREEAERLERERQQKEKDRILRRIMDSNVRMMGTGFRQAFQWMEAEREKEIALMRRQRGIMRRIVDSNVRLMSAGYNKLIEEWKARNNALKEKLRFVIAALTDKDKQFTLMAYNGLKQRALMLNGVGMGDAEKKKK